MSALPGLSALVRLRCSRENDSMNVFEQAHFERVEFCDDDASGLHAMNVIHSTRLGPALRGTRFIPTKPTMARCMM